MNSLSLKPVAEITSLSPQFLVDDLAKAIDYYRDRLGFDPDFVYESFYASVSRTGFSIHLKSAPKTDADRTRRKRNEHLDAFVAVRGIEVLFDEFKSKGAHIIRRSNTDRWVARTFTSKMPTVIFFASVNRQSDIRKLHARRVRSPLPNESYQSTFSFSGPVVRHIGDLIFSTWADKTNLYKLAGS